MLTTGWTSSPHPPDALTMAETLALAVNHPVQVRDGSVLEVRPIHPDDGDRLRRFHARLSPTTIALRYFHLMTCLPDALVASFTHLDYVDRLALVATHESASTDAMAAASSAEEIVSLANYERISADTAEIAFVVEDAWQGQGLASILLYDLAVSAHACGFSRFLAILLYRNRGMLALLQHCGFPCLLHDHGDDEISAWLDITAPPRCCFPVHAHLLRA